MFDLEWERGIDATLRGIRMRDFTFRAIDHLLEQRFGSLDRRAADLAIFR